MYGRHYVKLVDYMGGDYGYFVGSPYSDFIKVRTVTGKIVICKRKHFIPSSEKEFNRVYNKILKQEHE